MPALFPQWSNTLLRVVLVAVALGLALLIATPMIIVRTPFARGQYEPQDQPVQFDHRHHVRDDRIDCRYCHSSAQRAATAGVPSTDVCMGCHAQIWSTSPMLEVVRQSYFSKSPIPWNRVHALPDFVFFNHSIHVNKGVGCETCHGRVDEMALALQVAPLTMQWCLDCHRNPERHLRPLEAIAEMGFKSKEPQSVAGPRLAEELQVRSLTTCTTCHR